MFTRLKCDNVDETWPIGRVPVCRLYSPANSPAEILLKRAGSPARHRCAVQESPQRGVNWEIPFGIGPNLLRRLLFGRISEIREDARRSNEPEG
ncbi:MAG: hypothetical protein DWQ34_10295 [Planctomycetota bacterium]|nr:MAG: hypothetical protein DWQ29_15120 [Planctomycetota bacterium]REJ93611.1 MAG: hypothetical protein DWQ34_10295 [Planctomycetota bacterium]REK19929.1 MAG: hypothetical protein DWQ41_26745 [Planctomycetota bacterium]REK27494.1 MAG: hypothetical protein DWQ45_25760 [Planctomycetota bacterium]